MVLKDVGEIRTGMGGGIFRDLSWGSGCIGTLSESPIQMGFNRL